jgi:hypothetical protein
MTNTRLDDLDTAYSEAEEINYSAMPDGSYQTRIDSLEIQLSTKGDRLLKWTFIPLNPKYKSRKIWKYSMLKAENMGYLKSDLGRLGIKLNKISDLPDRLEEFLDMNVELKLVTKEYMGKLNQNVNIVKRISEADEMSAYENLPF